MKNLILLLFLILMVARGNAQKLPLYLNNDTSKYIYPPLYIINTPSKSDVIANPYTINNIAPKDIKSIDVYKNDSVKRIYGAKAKYGVVIVKYIKDISISTGSANGFGTVLKNYKISMKDQSLPLYIDSLYVNHPEDVYIDTAQIISVKVETETNSNIRFINVITNKSRQINKPGEVYIRGSVPL